MTPSWTALEYDQQVHHVLLTALKSGTSTIFPSESSSAVFISMFLLKWALTACRPTHKTQKEDQVAEEKTLPNRVNNGLNRSPTAVMHMKPRILALFEPVICWPLISESVSSWCVCSVHTAWLYPAHWPLCLPSLTCRFQRFLKSMAANANTLYWSFLTNGRLNIFTSGSNSCALNPHVCSVASVLLGKNGAPGDYATQNIKNISVLQDSPRDCVHANETQNTEQFAAHRGEQIVQSKNVFIILASSDSTWCGSFPKMLKSCIRVVLWCKRRYLLLSQWLSTGKTLQRLRTAAERLRRWRRRPPSSWDAETRRASSSRCRKPSSPHI